MEQFKDIEGYEGLYQVSNLGNVKSLAKNDGNGNRDRLLKFDTKETSHTNYYRVTLCVDGITKRFQVHQLVARAFIPNPQNKPIVNHIDNNGTNNIVSNLEWVTHQENMMHAQKQGRLFASQQAGGLASGALRAKKTISNIENDIANGKVYNNYKPIKFNQDAFDKHRKYQVTCKCLLCGQEKLVSYYRLINGKSKNCSKCSQQARKAAEMLDFIKAQFGKRIGSWLVSEEYAIVKQASVVNVSFNKLNCVNCFNTITAKTQYVHRNIHIPICRVCSINSELKQNLNNG